MSRPQVWRGRPHTPNLVPGHRVYGEKLVRRQGREWRSWSVYRSKLAAYVAAKGRLLDPGDDEHWLYLGAASGTTVSHVSDLVPQGRVTAVESSPRPLPDLLGLAAVRSNLVPLAADARNPDSFAAWIERRVDVLYQDVAQRDQARIFTANAKRFLRPGGLGFLAIKARSIDVAKDPQAVFRNVRSELESEGLVTREAVRLDRWQRDHAMLVVNA